MKFPLKERPFDLVQISPERLLELERTAQRVVDANLNEFHAFVHQQNRVMPKSQYKAIKKRDNVTVYKQTTRPNERAFGPLGVPSRHAHAPLQLPKLVAVGTVRGRMDDMLLGTAVRDPASVVVKTSYVNDEIVDCSVLHEMQGASPQDPFRFLALKWIVKSGSMNNVVAPRDMIVVQSSGLLASEGIGYHLLHSVDADVPECPSLEEKFGILRSRISTMFIFRQLAPDVIEIYTINYVEPNGSAPEAVAVLKSAKSMGASWKSLGYSHNLKLSWILKNKELYMGVSSHAHTETMNTGDDCELCHKKATLTGRLDDCSLCDARVCSRCRVTKKLNKANRRLELKSEKYEVCKTCLFRVVNEDAVRIAAEMNVGVPVTPWHKTNDLGQRKFSYAGTHSDTSSQRSGPSSSSRSHTSSRRQHPRDTFSTLSSGQSATGYERDLDTLAYSKLIDHSSRRKTLRDPSMASSEAYTDLDFDGHEFHDGHYHDQDDDDDVKSVDLLSTDELDCHSSHPKTFAMTPQQLHEKKKQELYRQYQRQLQEMEDMEAQTRHHNEPMKEQQITPYRRASSSVAPTRAPPPAPPRTASSARAYKMEVDELRSGDPSQDHFHKLYAQMKSLQLAAEKTFEITRDNERKLSHESQRQWER